MENPGTAAPADNQDAAVPTEPTAQQLNIKVKAQDGTEIFFKIKKST